MEDEFPVDHIPSFKLSGNPKIQRFLVVETPNAILLCGLCSDYKERGAALLFEGSKVCLGKGNLFWRINELAKAKEVGSDEIV